MISIPIHLQETHGVERVGELIQFGVPLPRGAVHDADNLCLADGGKSLKASISPLSQWPDQSLKWVLVRHLAACAPNAHETLTLTTSARDETQAGPQQQSVSIIGKRISVGDRTTEIGQDQLYLGPWVQWHASLKVCDEAGNLLKTRVTQIELMSCDAVQTTILQTGVVTGGDGKLFLDFEIEVQLPADFSQATCKVTVHNPRAARHPGGVWDLGDEGSRFFKSCEIVIEAASQVTCRFKPTPEDVWLDAAAAGFHLQQCASNGGNWRSPVHRDQHGEIPMDFKGYRLALDGHNKCVSGRAQPMLSMCAGEQTLTLSISRFWENFPTAIAFADGKARLQLFPESNTDHELQGGESKTHTILLRHSQGALGAGEERLFPLVVRVDAQAFATAAQLALSGDAVSPGYYLLPDLAGEFLAKREVIDEYGWRNFGEVYADHENDFEEDGNLLVSHYNNQYDVLHGFQRQFIATGDARWQQLADDLAEHIMDVDHYRTNEDRRLYNYGLFWHTDHYLDAGLATHRTFSRLQAKGAYDDHARGGGPGREHCYTRGLLFQYLMNGDRRARRALLEMTDWMIAASDSGTTLVERCVNLIRKDLPVIRRVLAGAKEPRHRYPLRRGPANFLMTLLDAYQLSSEPRYLAAAEGVISKTVHPDDDLEQRDLLNVEPNWSYLIFLTALGEYLQTKHTLGEFDAAFQYARDTLTHYADWIAKHERPFLSVPEILEFENLTWAAQDVRKATVLAYAAKFADNESDAFRYVERGRYFYNYVVHTLHGSDTEAYTRIQAILLQAYGVQELLFAQQVWAAVPAVEYKRKSLKMRTVPWLLGQFAVDCARRLANISLKAEWRWISHVLLSSQAPKD